MSIKVNLHLIPNLHLLVAAYALLLVYIFAIVGLGIVPIFSNENYFSFTTPVTMQADPTRLITVSDGGTLVVLVLAIAIEQGIDTFINEILSWHGHVPFYIECSNIIAHYLRYAIQVVFLRSQVSFVVGVIVIDTLATIACKKTSLAIRQKYESSISTEKHGRKVSKLDLACICILRMASVSLFILVYIYSNLFDSAYFSIGVPLIVFETSRIDSDVAYWSTVTAVFAFACLSVAAKNNIDRWHSGVLHNTKEDKTGMSEWETRLISLNRVVLLYLSIMFIYTFITTQFLFVLVYLTADLFMTGVHRFRNISRENEPTTVILVTIAQTIFEGIVIVMIASSHWFDDSYFSWGKDVQVFGTPVEKGPDLQILLAYVAFERVAMTLCTTVVQTDIAAWLYEHAPNSDLDEYSPDAILWIATATRLATWFYFVLRIQFILTNYSFVVISAAVDIPLTALINEVHMTYKKSMGENRKVMDFYKKLEKTT